MTVFLSSAIIKHTFNDERQKMKENIHPNYHVADCVCACGAKFKIGTTKNTELLHVDVCNECHPFYTGKQKIVDTGGRVDKFRKRYSLDK